LGEDTRLVAGIDRDFWAGRRVLLTGHTGFKGAWTALWLQALGARVVGLAPSGPPTRPSLFELARVGEGLAGERAADVRDADALLAAVAQERPEVVLHLAAQPLVRRSYREPAHTYEVNVMGTVNVLEAVRRAGEGVRAVVVVTSDKCYDNPPGGVRRFVEGDPLGGEDPYSSSKACAELVTAAYRSSFFARAGAGTGGPRVASARAGNVIGGGDWGADRLIPDIVRAVAAGESVRVRNPRAMRPWQHVLNPLSGYLVLAQELWRTPEAVGAWNFGPAPEDARPVGWIVQRLAEHWGGALRWEAGSAARRAAAAPVRWEAGGAALGGEDGAAAEAGADGADPPEAGHLALDSTKAERGLGWHPAWGLEEALERVVSWHEAHRRGVDMRAVSLAQIAEFS
jgi:CDP-glucose 4,6-dehydratase